MLVTNHVLSGALIGAAVRRPLPAFAMGVASHFVLDAVPHWGKWRNRQHFLKVAVADGLAGLAAIGTCAAIARPGHRLAIVAGMAGAALPDLDKPGELVLGRSPWPAAVNRFHGVIQDEAADRFGQEMIVMGVLAVAALLAARGMPPGRGRRRATIQDDAGRPGRPYR
ncbi:MAG: hypothetical protein JO345_01625 [Streptosporangiaceae bacterium]|nr:hypothetical protein [Streptosporangiaceae bacterium]